MCGDLIGKYEESRCVWIRVCYGGCMEKVYWNL